MEIEKVTIVENEQYNGHIGGEKILKNTESAEECGCV